MTASEKIARLLEMEAAATNPRSAYHVSLSAEESFVQEMRATGRPLLLAIQALLVEREQSCPNLSDQYDAWLAAHEATDAALKELEDAPEETQR